MAPLPSPHAKTVMLVEADQDDRGMYAEYLISSGFRVIEVGDTAIALESATAADIIVTGIHLPGPFDGLELLRRLRKDDRTSHLPLIVLTAYVFDRERRRSVSAGCDAFLAKPCLPADLLQTIRRVLLAGAHRRSAAHGKFIHARTNLN